MWWAPFLVIGLLLGARRSVQLAARHSYRFVVRVDGAPDDVDGPALVELLESEGATDVLVTKGKPQLAVYSYAPGVESSVQLASTRSVMVAGVHCGLTLLEVTEIA